MVQGISTPFSYFGRFVKEYVHGAVSPPPSAVPSSTMLSWSTAFLNNRMVTEAGRTPS